MGESRGHIELVAIAVNYIKTMVDQNYQSIIQYDSADSQRPTKVIGNFIPDAYFWHDEQLIIGEAKTIHDFDRPHSREQYDAYLMECASFYGSATLVISVPWQLVATAKNYFRRRKKQLGVEVPVIIVNEMGKDYKI